MKALSLVPVLALLAGCAANSYCLGEQNYQAAASVPPLKPAADGARIAESSSALRIPPPPANKVPYGEVVKNADGDEETSCLDKPPQMTAVAEAPQPAAPPPAPKPVEVQTPPEATPAQPPAEPAKPAAPAKKKAAATKK